MTRPRMSIHPSRPLRVGFYGVLGSGNTGNDASLDLVIRFLRDRHPEAHVGFLAMGPDRLTARYGAHIKVDQHGSRVIFNVHRDIWA